MDPKKFFNVKKTFPQILNIQIQTESRRSWKIKLWVNVNLKIYWKK